MPHRGHVKRIEQDLLFDALMRAIAFLYGAHIDALTNLTSCAMSGVLQMLQRPDAFNNVGILNIRCRFHPRSLALYAETAPDRSLVKTTLLVSIPDDLLRNPLRGCSMA
jgi:hypothetical protein